MNKMFQTFKLTALSAALLAVYGPAQADDAATAELVQLTKPDSTLSVGIGSWSADRPQQGIYDGMRDSGAYGLLDADIVKRDDATGTWMKLNASNLGLDTREIRGEYLRQGDIGGFIEYSRTPRDNPNTFNTGLQGIGTTFQTISGAGANALPMREVTLGTVRDLTHLGFYKNLMPGLDFKVSFKNEEKEGTRHWGMGSQALFMVEPINSTTRQLEMILDYTGKQLQLQGGYYGSAYDNANSLARGLVNGAAQPGTTSSPNPVPLSLPLDNLAHQVFLNGGYAFTPTTRGTFKLAYTHATQDETLPTFDLEAPNNRFVGAPSSLNGEINTTTAQLGITSRPMPKLSLLANLRYQDVDDQTPLAGFAGNNTTGVISVHNTPHSFTTTSGKAEATYRLPADFSVTGGVDISKQDRTYPQFEAERYVPFRANLDETTYRLQLRRSLSDTLNGSLAYLHSDRDGSGFTTTNEEESDEINPIHISDRKRDKWRLALDWSPMEKLSFQFAVEDAKDDYGHDGARPFGLRDGSGKLYSVDANYAVNDDWQISAWFSRDDTRATQIGQRAPRDGAAAAEKDAQLQDVGDSVGLGLRGKATSKLDIGADLQWTRNNSKYNESLTLVGTGALLPVSGGQTIAAPLPDIENNLSRLKLFGVYALQKNADLRVELIHERWKTDDWSWMFANGTPFTYGTTTDGTTVTANQKQTSNFVSVRYIYKFQ